MMDLQQVLILRELIFILFQKYSYPLFEQCMFSQSQNTSDLSFWISVHATDGKEMCTKL